MRVGAAIVSTCPGCHSHSSSARHSLGNVGTGSGAPPTASSCSLAWRPPRRRSCRRSQPARPIGRPPGRRRPPSSRWLRAHPVRRPCRGWVHRARGGGRCPRERPRPWRSWRLRSAPTRPPPRPSGRPRRPRVTFSNISPARRVFRAGENHTPASPPGSQAGWATMRTPETRSTTPTTGVSRRPARPTLS